MLVTGGAGYVGSALVPRLLARGYRVRVLDLFIYGDDVLGGHPIAGLELLRGDIRDLRLCATALHECDSVIHLACISNDPSFDLDAALGKSVNYDAFEPLVRQARAAGVRRFIYASSSSVYGVKAEPDVREESPLSPLTDYSRYKAMCEEVLARYQSPDFLTVTLRPATVCGYAPRQRLDVIVNILTNHAVNTGKIIVHGGNQLRPNLHIRDMVHVYERLLDAPAEPIAGQIFNVGYGNFTVNELAEKVRTVVGRDRVSIITEPTNDQRSYHISSDKIARGLGFRAQHSIEEAVAELAAALTDGRLPKALTDNRYFNVRTMKDLGLQ